MGSTSHSGPANALALVVAEAAALPVGLHICDALVVLGGQIGIAVAVHWCIDHGLTISGSGICTCSPKPHELLRLDVKNEVQTSGKGLERDGVVHHNLHEEVSSACSSPRSRHEEGSSQLKASISLYHQVLLRGGKERQVGKPSTGKIRCRASLAGYEDRVVQGMLGLW